MKLCFNPALTRKPHLLFGLDIVLNWPVLPFGARGNHVLPGESSKRAVYRFGPFQLDATNTTLTRNGNQLKLQDLPYRLLVILVERPGEIVSREEVRQRLWPQNTFVEFDNSLGVAIRKIRDALGDNADAPCYVETVPRRGYRFLATVTAARESHDAVLPRVTEPVRPPLSSLSAEKRPAISGQRLRHLVIATFIVVVIGVVAYRFRFLHSRSENQAAAETNLPPVHVRRSVAVMGFRNLPGRPEDNWLSPAFAEMLSTELAADSALRMVSGEDVARAKRELPLNDEDSLAKETLQRLHTNPGADVVVLGSYTPLPGKGDRRIRLDVRLQDTARGETIAEQAFVGSEDDLFELVGQAGASLRQSLGATLVSEEVAAQTRAALPVKPLAVRLYTEGRARLWAFDFIHARDLLVQAIAVEPEFPLAHSALSDAWDHLGYDLKARDEAEHARALSEHLGVEARLQIEGQYYSSLRDTNKAIEVYKKLFAQFPDNLNYGLRLADEQRRVSSEDALKTLAALRRLPGPAANDPRIDMIESRAWMNNDYAKAQAAGRRAVEKGNAQGAHLLVARAYGILCQAQSGSSTEQAVRDCQNARQSYAAAGDRNNEARTLNDFAGLYYQMGQIDEAENMFRQALTMFREIGAIDGITTASNNLGDVFLARGNLASAERALADALPGYKEMGDKDGIALTLNDLGEVARRRGDLEKALRTFEQAKTVAQGADDKSAMAYVLSGRGDVLADRGDLVGARKSYAEALAIRKQTGEKQTAAETELALARLAIEEGNAADAETVIRKCKEQFHQDQQADDELAASIVLIDAFLTESKLSEATLEAGQTKSLADKSANTLLHMQFDIMSARAEGLSGHFPSASADLERTFENAHSHQLLGLELETRLAVTELKNKSGQSVAASAESLSLENSARRNGFGLIADKALSFRIARE
ncbi:MAG TPA: tetratricopeptide repeat protein [Candidatus Dormibacteraeota bacterium]|nr:tetratricopeptide repeat protein [Candidatus Dormibacteraeota bacterium]